MHFKGVLCTIAFAALASAAVAKQVPTPGWDKYAGEREETPDVVAREAEPDPEAEAELGWAERRPGYKPFKHARDAEAEPEPEAAVGSEAEAAWSAAHGGPPPSYAYADYTDVDFYPTPLATHAANWASRLSSLAANAVPTLNAREAEPEAEPKMTHAPSHTVPSWAKAGDWRGWLVAHPQVSAHHASKQVKEGVKHAARAVTDAVGLETEADDVDNMTAQFRREFLELHPDLEARDIDFGPADNTVYDFDEALNRRDAEADVTEGDMWMQPYDGPPVERRDANPEEFDYSQEGYGDDSIPGVEDENYHYPYEDPVQRGEAGEDIDFSQEGYGDNYAPNVADDIDFSQGYGKNSARDVEAEGDDWLLPYDETVQRRDAEPEEFDWSSLEGSDDVYARDAGEDIDLSEQGYSDNYARDVVEVDWLHPTDQEDILERDAEPDARNVFMPGMGAHPEEVRAAATARAKDPPMMVARAVDEEIYPFYDESVEVRNVPVETLPTATQKSKWFPW